MPAAAFELLELAYNIPAYRRLKREAEAFRPDVLYERNNLFLLAGLRLKRKLGLPMLLEINAPLAEERSRFGNLALKEFGAAHGARGLARCGCGAAGDAGAGRHGGANTRDQGIHVIPNGADLEIPAADIDVRARFGLEDKVVLGFVGFVRPWHGLEWAIRALPRLGSDVHLLVVGDGPAQESLEKKPPALGVTDRVHFVGRVPHHEISAFVQSFDIALQTSAVGYASPLKLFEYMALGRAIIAPDQPNLREVLKPDVDALLFDPGDEASFFAALQQLSADAPIARAAGRCRPAFGRGNAVYLGGECAPRRRAGECAIVLERQGHVHPGNPRRARMRLAIRAPRDDGAQVINHMNQDFSRRFHRPLLTLILIYIS